jgi:hypothetical protein
MRRVDSFILQTHEAVGGTTIRTQIIGNVVDVIFSSELQQKDYEEVIDLMILNLSDLFISNYRFSKYSMVIQGNFVWRVAVEPVIGQPEWDKKFLSYLDYLVHHKYYVFRECCKLGIRQLGVVHDSSKLGVEEWFHYAEYFCGNEKTQGVKDNFDVSWLHHIHHNQHHWQHWILHEDSGEVKVLPMPQIYALEMVADWRGVGFARKGYDESQSWYLKSKESMQLHPDTRKLVESLLGL